MKKSVRVLLTLALALLFSLPTYASGGGEKKVFTVAFMPGAADPFYYTMERGVRQKAKELGMNVVVGDYPDSWDPGKQIANLQALTAKGGIDFLLIAPASPAALVAPLKAIKDKGTAIVTVATFLGDGDYTRTSSYSFPLAHIGTDDRLGGRLVAERLAKLIGGKGKVYVMNTSPDVSSDTDRGDGFRDGIAEFPKIRLVGMDYCGGSQERAAELTTSALMKDPDIVGIFAAGEPGALGAAQSVRSAGLLRRGESGIVGRDPGSRGRCKGERHRLRAGAASRGNGFPGNRRRLQVPRHEDHAAKEDRSRVPVHHAG